MFAFVSIQVAPFPYRYCVPRYSNRTHCCILSLDFVCLYVLPRVVAFLADIPCRCRLYGAVRPVLRLLRQQSLHLWLLAVAGHSSLRGLFVRVCSGKGSTVHLVCANCRSLLPYTSFEWVQSHPMPHAVAPFHVDLHVLRPLWR